MTRRLVFVHGRAQEDKDARAIKREWIGALRKGLARSGLDLPVDESAVRFPYYGNTLRDLLRDVPADKIAEVVVRGEGTSEDHRAFVRSVVEEIRVEKGISEAQLADVAGREVVERGPLNWPWLQAVLEVVDRHIPFASGASIALATNDVYHYLRNIGVRDAIESGVRRAIEPGVPTVVVGHSLGSVVAYAMLRREGDASDWQVPLLVTVGSPLAVTAIKRALAPVKHPACVGTWFNAMDDRDVVALYALDTAHFPVDPAIENKTDVDNGTSNRHGITGYLDDPVVARRIHDALVT